MHDNGDELADPRRIGPLPDSHLQCGPVQFRQYELQHKHRGDDPVQFLCDGVVMLPL